MLDRFHVKNYKCLRDVTVPLTPIHVLIGQNDAGKSSLLEAVYAFFRSSSFLLPEAFSGHWLGDDLVYEDAAESCITLEGTWDHFGTYGLSVAFATAANRTCTTVDEWHISGSRDVPEDPRESVFLPPEPAAERNILGSKKLKYANLNLRLSEVRLSNEDRTSVYRRRTETGLGAVGRIIQQEIGKLTDGTHLYRLDPRLMAIPSELSSKRKFRLDPDGFGLPGLLDDILGYDIGQFAKIRDEFCRFFPQFRSVRVETEQGIHREFHETGRHTSGEVVGKGIHFETQGRKSIRAQQASDGAILFLGFLALANLPHPPKMLLIEEPETGIYPERLGQVIELLRKMTGEAGENAPQVVFTTHSPYVLSFFKPEEVTFMSRTDDGAVRARPLRDAPHIQERLEGFYLGELWYNLSEAELFADA